MSNYQLDNKEIPRTGKLANDTYQLSGKTGSLRYMAPEVAKEQPYNETVDVYSLAILAWQIFEMDTPYKGYSIAMHNNLVIEKGGRHTTYYDDNIYEWSAKGSSCVGNAGERSRDYEDSPTQAKASGISLFINSSRSLLVPFSFFLLW